MPKNVMIKPTFRETRQADVDLIRRRHNGAIVTTDEGIAQDEVTTPTASVV